MDKSSFKRISIYMGIDFDRLNAFCWPLLFTSDEVSLSHTAKALVRCPKSQTSHLRPSDMCGSTPPSLRKCLTRLCCTWWKTAGERGGIEMWRESKLDQFLSGTIKLASCHYVKLKWLLILFQQVLWEGGYPNGPCGRPYPRLFVR